MTVTTTVDVNSAFAAERADQIQAAADRQADFDARVADGRLVPLGNGRFQVNDPGSYDNGEVLVQQDGQILPQHGLDTSLGQVALYSSVPAWHELGNIIPGGTADVEQLEAMNAIAARHTVTHLGMPDFRAAIGRLTPDP